MYVGVILTIDDELIDQSGIPHVCGGDPDILNDTELSFKYSPCMWG